jgi:hypothetical protein
VGFVTLEGRTQDRHGPAVVDRAAQAAAGEGVALTQAVGLIVVQGALPDR